MCRGINVFGFASDCKSRLGLLLMIEKAGKCWVVSLRVSGIYGLYGFRVLNFVYCIIINIYLYYTMALNDICFFLMTLNDTDP